MRDDRIALSGFLSPLPGWRINPGIYDNRGYPYGSALPTAASVNGKP